MGNITFAILDFIKLFEVVLSIEKVVPIFVFLLFIFFASFLEFLKALRGLFGLDKVVVSLNVEVSGVIILLKSLIKHQ